MSYHRNRRTVDSLCDRDYKAMCNIDVSKFTEKTTMTSEENWSIKIEPIFSDVHNLFEGRDRYEYFVFWECQVAGTKTTIFSISKWAPMC